MFYNEVDPLKSSVTGPSLLVNCYLENKFHKKIRVNPPPLNVETGRYGEKRFNIKHRACRHCCSSDDDLLDLLYELPGAYPVIEDEHHILYECPLYEDLRENLHQRTRDLLVMREEPGEIFDDSTSIRDIGRFLIKVDERRFPKKNTE